MWFVGLAVAAILAVAVPAAAAEPPGGQTLLHLNETAERMVPRDRLTIDMRVEVADTDRVRVQAELNRRMSAALDKVRAARTVEVASGSYQTEERTPPGAGDKPTQPEWHAFQDLILIGRDFATLLNLAGQLQADGLTMGDMNFDVAPETLRAAQRSLTDDALNALTARAREIAATLRLSVARIVTLRVGNATQPGGVRPVMMQARALEAAAPPPAAAAGNGTIALTIDADIALVPEK
jgi:predicted secreted protein